MVYIQRASLLQSRPDARLPPREVMIEIFKPTKRERELVRELAEGGAITYIEQAIQPIEIPPWMHDSEMKQYVKGPVTMKIELE